MSEILLKPGETPLADWRAAFEAMRDSRMVGKIVLEP